MMNRTALDDLECLPEFDPIIESEHHVLTECPSYHHLRIQLSDKLKTNLLLLQYSHIMTHPLLAEELGSFLYKCYVQRKPQTKKTV